MAEKYTEAQKKATLKYQAKMSQIKITITSEEKERYQKLAKDRGIPLTKLIKELLDNIQ